VRSPQRQNENNISRPFRLRLTLAVVGFRRIKLGKTSSSYRDAVDRISLCDPLASDGIPALAQSGQRRPGGVRQPSGCFDQVRDGRAFGPLQQVDHTRELAARSRRECFGGFADDVRTAGFGRVRMRLQLRRFL
jgi:hypothetical protein